MSDRRVGRDVPANGASPATVVEPVRIGPGQAIRVTRTGADGKERIAFIGLIDEVASEGDQLSVTVYAPTKLVTDRREPPFPTPMSDYVLAPKVFDFWWKQLDYVFELPDPWTFPPLPTTLSTDELDIVQRYIRIAANLAGSGVLNALEEGFDVQIPDGPTGIEKIEKRFSPADLQVGFAGLLRQCDSPYERARFERVRGILWQAAEAAHDSERDLRLEHLRTWGGAAKALRKKSLDQLLRDKLVRDEGMRVFEYDEEHSPEQLLKIYNYGELLHWGEESETVAEFERDEFVDSDRRLAYLEAAGALGQLYVGFGELARRAVR